MSRGFWLIGWFESGFPVVTPGDWRFFGFECSCAVACGILFH